MLTEEKKAELIKRHATTYRNRHVDTKALGFTEADLNALIADVEQAVRKEMEGDVKDAERYRWLRDKTEWELFDSSWLSKVDLYGGEASDMDAFFDAARGQT